MRYSRLLPALLGLALAAAPAAAQEPTLPTGRPERPDVRKPPPAAPAPRDTVRARAPRQEGVPPAADSAAAAGPQQADSVYQQLLRVEGYVPVEYEGKTAEFRAEEGTLRLWGDAVVSREGEKLQADSIVYHEESKVTTAFGSPKVSGREQNIEGDVLVYNLERRLARVAGGRTQFSQTGATWYVRGDTVTAEQESSRVYALNSTFTTDERPEPQYHFKAGKIMVVKDRLLVGRPAKLYFRNVPVAWLPFIVQDMEKGRRSGILTPRFGINDIVRTNSGYQREISNVGYYWAISEYMGAQVSGAWRSNSYTSLTGSLDFNWRRKFLNGNFSWLQYFPEDGSKQRTLNGTASWKPDERTDLSAQGSYASSSRFVRERSTDPFEAMQTMQSTLSLRRRFGWGDVSLGAERRQTLGNDRVEWTFPNLAVTPQTITLFPAASPDAARWYNNLSVTLGASGGWSGVDLPVLTGLRPTATGDSVLTLLGERSIRRGNASLSNNVTLGDLGLSNTLTLNRSDPFEVPGVDDGVTLDEDRASWSSSLSYRVGLVGTTYIAPTLQLSQEIRRDTLTSRFGPEFGRGADGYVSGPMRLSFGANLNTDLFGFFPGVGPLERIRHHVRPGVNYRYFPAVRPDSLQMRVFGAAVGNTQNVVTLTLDQTFEGKLRSATPQAQPQPGDTAAAGADTVPGTQTAAPAEARKVTLLALNTSGFDYDIEQRRLLTDQVTGSIRSDYLRGLNLSFGFDLFENATQEELQEDQFAHGGFAPLLSSLSTSFSLGEGSALFRWVGGLLGRGRESMVPVEGMVPDSAAPPAAQPGSPTATANPQGGVGGPWNASFQYSLSRQRASVFEQAPGTGIGPGVPALGRVPGELQQNLNMTLNFSPTRNWQVNWQTTYDLTQGEFGIHSLRLVRDLYRWQANFSFNRTPIGNTSFDFSVHLKDLPDLKLDYRERDIGVDRRGR